MRLADQELTRNGDVLCEPYGAPPERRLFEVVVAINISLLRSESVPSEGAAFRIGTGFMDWLKEPESVKSKVQRRLRAPMSSAAGALRSSTVQQCVIPDT
jgi:hypothetical protein